jgi:hypothetical protein
MITKFDDYPVHQTAEPVSQPASSSLNVYDRYWFNGFDRDGKFYFGAALGLYPNRHVMDGAFSVSIDGEQHSFFASRRAGAERSDTAIGPLSVEVVKPLRVIRVRLAANDTGIECDLTFSARTIAYEEPRSILREEGRVMLDTTRLTQFGSWEGYFSVAGVRTEVRPAAVLGVRDRSWGMRPVGEKEGGAPSMSEPGIFWTWSVNHFDDVCVHYATFEDHEGHPVQLSGAVLPAFANVDDIPTEGEPWAYAMPGRPVISYEWKKGTRMAASAKLEVPTRTGEKQTITIEPLLLFHMKGLGYQHPKWAHAVWKGELVTGSESWRTDEQDPLAYENIHVHQVCRVTMGDKVGTGVLEQLIFGSHKPSVFKGFFDGAE